MRIHIHIADDDDLLLRRRSHTTTRVRPAHDPLVALQGCVGGLESSLAGMSTASVGVDWSSCLHSFEAEIDHTCYLLVHGPCCKRIKC